MKSLLGGLILLACVNATAAIANDSVVTMVCLSESGETFTVFVKNNDAMIKWPQGAFPAEIAVQGPKIYLKQTGEYGTMAVVYDMELKVGLAITKFNNGNVITNPIRCSIN